MATNKSDYRALTAAEVIDVLKRPAPTVVLFHARPDPDAVGSAFALSLWLRAMGSEAYCICPGEIPARLRFLTDGLQQSAAPSSLPAQFADARVIAVDTASPAQLEDLYPAYAGRITLMIDHHGKGQPFADHLILPKAAAAGEIVYDLIAESRADIPHEAAALLYAAISGDTGCFKFSNVTPKTHLRAAALVGMGIDAAEINRRLFDSKPLSMLRAEAAGFSRMQFFFEGRLSVIDFPYTLKTELGATDEDLETLIDVARSVTGVEVAVAIRQPAPEGRFRVSMRAAVDFDVSAVCADLGGGGHVRAAGATLSAPDMPAAVTAVLEAVRAHRF